MDILKSGRLTKWMDECSKKWDIAKMTFIKIFVMNSVFTEKDWGECHLCFILFFQDVHPSIHPSIYAISHRHCNISVAPFNNPPDQIVSKPTHFEGSNWLVRWIVEISSLHSLEFGTQTFYTIHPSFRPSFRPSIYSVIHF